MVTWLQLGFHQKPVALLNIDAFYQHLLGFFDHCVSEVSRSASINRMPLLGCGGRQTRSGALIIGTAGHRALFGHPVEKCSFVAAIQPTSSTNLKPSSVRLSLACMSVHVLADCHDVDTVGC
jgi:Possible lysine decarboxylase